MSGNNFDKDVMPSAGAARRENRCQLRGLWIYVFIAVLVGAVILGIVASALQ